MNSICISLNIFKKYCFVVFLLLLGSNSFQAQSNYGGLDISFNPTDVGFQKNHGASPSTNGLFGGINDFQFRPDGKIYLSGGFVGYSGYYSSQIIRLNSDLSYDDSFQWNIGYPASWTSGMVCFGLQPNGNIVLGGNFSGSSQYTKRICGLLPSGNLNSSFFVGNIASTAGANNDVLDMLSLSTGKVIVAGKFSSFAGTATNHIFRAGVNGGKDATFNVGLGITSSFITSYITKVEPTMNGKTLVIGTFTSWNNLSYNGIVRLQENGVLDSSFVIGTGPNGSVNAIHELSNGKIVVGGNFTSFNGASCSNICVLNSDGSVDLTFLSGTGLNGIPYAISSDAAGEILVGGIFSDYNGTARENFVAILQNGMVAADYQADFNGRVSRIKRHTDGKVYFSGLFTGVNGHGIKSLGRFDSNGMLDTLYNRSTGANFLLNNIGQVAPNKLVVSGIHSAYNGVHIPSSVHFIDTIGNFIPSPLDTFTSFREVRIVKVDSSDRVLVAGSAQIPVIPNQRIVYRFDQNGILDSTFQSALPATVNDQMIDLEILSNGKMYALYQSTNTFYLQRINQNGAIDSSFALVTINTGAFNIQIIENDAVLVTGYNMSVNGGSASSVAKINSDGTVNAQFSPGFGANNTCISALVLSNGNYLIGGNFTTWSGTPKKGYVVLSKFTGLPDNGFQYTVNYSSVQQVRSSKILPNGKIVLFGSFQNSASDYTSSVIIYPNGLRDNNYQGYKLDNIEYLGGITAVQQLPSGSFIYTGEFSSIQNEGANAIAKVTYTSTPVEYDTVILCDSYLAPNGLTYTTSTDSIYHSFVSTTGSDSLVMYTAFVYPTTYSTIQDTACGSYTWLITNLTYTNSGNFTGVTVNSNGCDSIITLNLTIIPITQDTLAVIACGNYFWNTTNQTYTNSGFYTDTLTNQYGCDSIITINLIVHPVFSDTLTDQACNSYTWTNGVTYYQSGFYSDTLSTVNGCDSILCLDLTLLHSFGTESILNCSSYTWPLNGQTYFVSGQYFDTLVNVLGCDSIVTLNLTILNSSVGTDVQVACDSYTWIDGITYTVSTNSPTFILSNSVGCDSIITLNLTVNYTSTATDIQTVCDSYTWIDGITYTSSTSSPTFTLTNSSGCDSIVTLNLSVNYSTTAIDVQTACDSYTWIDGITYTSSINSPTFTLTNSSGCDSMVTLNLIINNSTTATDIQTACNSYTWIDGITYTSSTNLPTFTLTNSSGCDSIVTLNLMILPSTSITINSTFSLPSDANSCIGELAIAVSGNPNFVLDIDNGSQVISSSGYSVVNNLCPGIHDLFITDNCGDTAVSQFVIPIDSNYVFNNPFLDSLAQDSLGTTLTNCTLHYNQIDTAYIDSIWAIGNTVNVIWNIVDSNGSNFDTTSYVLNNGNGVYWLQLSVFCPTKALGDYFAVTEAIYFNDGNVSSASLDEGDYWGISLYPNPTSNFITVTFENPEAQLTIRDAQGKLIRTTTIYNGATVSMINLETGVYFFEVQNEKGSVVKRVVKQ